MGRDRCGDARWHRAMEGGGGTGLQRHFSCDLHDRGGYVVLMTMHQSDRTERHALAREHVGGEVRSTKPVLRKGRVTGFQIKTPDPKA